MQNGKSARSVTGPENINRPAAPQRFRPQDERIIIKTGPVVDGEMMPLASCHRHNLVESLLSIEYAWLTARRKG
jgi:hypothetical protein